MTVRLGVYRGVAPRGPNSMCEVGHVKDGAGIGV